MIELKKREIMARVLAESLLIFGISGLVVKVPPAYILIYILTYTFFSLLLLGINYLSMRFLGADISMGILMVIYRFFRHMQKQKSL